MNPFPYSPLAWTVFKKVFGPRMRMGVHSIHLAGLPRALPQDHALLLVSNHVSWWDGFLLRSLHEALRPKARYHSVMLERELARRPFLKLLGGVGLTPGDPLSFRRLLIRMKETRLHFPDLTVLFFPQGRIWPSRRRPLGFMEGIRLLARALAPVTVLPVGLHLEPGRWPAPSAFISVGEPMEIEGGEARPGVLEEEVQRELDAILAFLESRGETGVEEWPPAHEVLPRAQSRTNTSWRV